MKSNAYPVKIAIFAFKLLTTLVRKRTQRHEAARSRFGGSQLRRHRAGYKGHAVRTCCRFSAACELRAHLHELVHALRLRERQRSLCLRHDAQVLHALLTGRSSPHGAWFAVEGGGGLGSAGGLERCDRVLQLHTPVRGSATA